MLQDMQASTAPGRLTGTGSTQTFVLITHVGTTGRDLALAQGIPATSAAIVTVDSNDLKNLGDEGRPCREGYGGVKSSDGWTLRVGNGG